MCWCTCTFIPHFFSMALVNMVSRILVIVGGLNWGLFGIFGIDLVAMLFGTATMLSKIVYGAVGVSALYATFTTLMKK